jgi:hypothetical protein
VSQFVIPAKSAGGGREPGSRKRLFIEYLGWIPDLVSMRRLVRNDGFARL